MIRRVRVRRPTLRVRLLLVSLGLVAVALAVGALVLYSVLSETVYRAIDRSTWATAQSLETLAQLGPIADPVPVSGIQVVQVVDDQNRVVTASANADRLTPMLQRAELERALTGEFVTVPGSRTAVSGPLRVAAIDIGGNQSVLVGAQVGEVQQSQDLLRNALLVSYPLLLGALGLIAWWVIGRTLRPVEELRVGAERISGSDQDERLPASQESDEIHALAVTLNRMLDRLAGSRARQRAFVADAAHELRSPVTSMRTQLEVAQRLGEGGELPDELLVDVHRLEVLVEDLLLLARSDADGRPLSTRESLDLRVLVADVVDRYAGARVPVRLGDGRTCTASANAEELRRALANLLDNAVRHAGSSVTVCVVIDGASALVTVEDDGPGIPVADRERVFERFTRLDDARGRDDGGSGLGLAIVREVLRRGGGSIRLADRTDGTSGLRAELRLPR